MGAGWLALLRRVKAATRQIGVATARPMSFQTEIRFGGRRTGWLVLTGGFVRVSALLQGAERRDDTAAPLRGRGQRHPRERRWSATWGGSNLRLSPGADRDAMRSCGGRRCAEDNVGERNELGRNAVRIGGVGDVATVEADEASAGNLLLERYADPIGDHGVAPSP